MTDRIFKYPLHMSTHVEQVVTMPNASKILHVAWQDMPCMWAHIGPDSVSTVKRTFQIVGTGHSWPEGYSYIGTCHAPPFVWHVLEKDS